MELKQLQQIRKDCLSRIEQVKKDENKKYATAAKKYILKHCPVKQSKVYELLENGIRRKGFRRFVIYEMDLQWFVGNPIIHVGGWWLDENNTPSKWDTMTVHGIGNPAIFKLSENQTHNPHPDLKKKKNEKSHR